MNLTEILPRAVSLHGSSTGMVCGHTRLSYRQVGERVGRLAEALGREFAVGPGVRFAALHRNCHRMLEMYFAAAHLGAVLVPLNHRLSAADLAYILVDTDCRCLVADNPHEELAREATALADIGCQVVTSPAEYEILVQTAQGASLRESSGLGEDAAQIYYTSGTTGHQKGVVLTHKNVTSHALATIAELHLSDSDTWAHMAPMFHLADAWATWAITWVGGRHVMVERFDPGPALKILVDEGITVTNLVPTMLNDLVSHVGEEVLPRHSLRLLMSGGAPISPHLVQRIVGLFRCKYVQTYGLTETSPYLTFSLLAKHLLELPEGDQMRYRSMTGRPALGVRLRVVDENGRDVAADGREIGEIVARGDRIMSGYWRLPEATAEAFDGGWFHTGDLATIDREGYLNIVDRKKDVVLTGGELVYSTEVENALASHPAVLECAVIGVSDERLGEAVHAVVVTREGMSLSLEDVVAHCRERLAHFKCPRTVKFAGSLPRTGSQKVSKRRLREQMRDSS